MFRDKIRFLIVSSFYAVLCLVWAETNEEGTRKQNAATSPQTTEIVLIGTLHGNHQENKAYSAKTLQSIIEAIRPLIILVEMPPEIGGKETVKNGRIPDKFSGNENTAANLVADSLGVALIPYDREGRNEIYKTTNYFERQSNAYKGLYAWIAECSQAEPESLEVLIVNNLFKSSMNAQAHLNQHDSPITVNSATHDEIIRNKKCIQHKIIPKLLLASEKKELANEFLFFREEWEMRNRIMADNIIESARKHAGKRIVVLCGAEHRYILRDLLRESKNIELKEFYEVSDLQSAASVITHSNTKQN